MSRYLELAKKLKTLSDQAKSEGERKNASALLSKIMLKHNISIDQVNEDENLQEYVFDIKAAKNRKLFVQVCCALFDRDVIIYTCHSPRKMRVVLNMAQKLELEVSFEVYLRAHSKQLKQMQKDFYQAFLIANHLFPKTPNPTAIGKETPLTLEEKQELRRQFSMAKGLEKTVVHKSLTTG
jgi:hypothetical protein